MDGADLGDQLSLGMLGRPLPLLTLGGPGVEGRGRDTSRLAGGDHGETGGLLCIETAVAGPGGSTSLYPEGHGSFEQITLHPQASVLTLERSQPGLLLGGQPLLLATVDAVLTYPVAQRGVVDPQLPGDRGDRSAGAADQLHRVALELLGEPSTGPLWPLSVFLSHEDILSSEVSCLLGEVQTAAPPI